jgi:REP element-mobilizing transposase RayT
MPDHVHMGIAIPPKHPVAPLIGFLKGEECHCGRSTVSQRAKLHGRVGAMRRPRSDSNWARSADTSANKERADGNPDADFGGGQGRQEFRGY